MVIKNIFFVFTLFFLLMSCKTGERQTAFTVKNIKEYNDTIKWKRFDHLVVYLKEDDYKTKNKIEETQKDVTIENYKILNFEKLTDVEYKCEIEREEFILPSNVLEKNKYVQYWVFSKEEKKWFLSDETESE